MTLRLLTHGRAALLVLLAGANLLAEPPAAPAPATSPAAPAPAVGEIQSVTIELKVIEVNLAKLRALGFSWDLIAKDGKPASGLPYAMNGKFATSQQFEGFLQALRQYDLAKVLCEPMLITLSGR